MFIVADLVSLNHVVGFIGHFSHSGVKGVRLVLKRVKLVIGVKLVRGHLKSQRDIELITGVRKFNSITRI